MSDKNLRYAVLIDAENVSLKYVKFILDEVSSYGIATYKRAYGDWTNPGTFNWKDIVLKNSITPVQQYSYTQGKNATDSAMIIDAMDILYTGRVDGFCIVSSDSDFTKLAARLREAGMMVIGMGEKKTVEAFRASCTQFKYLEMLAAEEVQENNVSRDEIEQTILKIINDNDANDKDTTVGELGNKIGNRHADFDVRNYGYSKLSKFLESFKSLRLVPSGNDILVYRAESGVKKEDAEGVVRQILKSVPSRTMMLPELKQKIEKKIPSFDVTDYKYSKFSQFLKDMDGLSVFNNMVRLDKNS